MPTTRAATFLIAAITFYLFGNQTQIGWLYVISALLAGLIPAAYWLNRRALRGITAERHTGGGLHAEIHEGDTLPIRLVLRCGHRISVAQLEVRETCPLAEPQRRVIDAYIPLIPARGAVQLEYDIVADRRGLYRFPPLWLTSRTPFGLFRRRAPLDVPSRVLVYPEVRRLERLDLFDRQLAAQQVFPRTGTGSEVLGVRPYRAGDSPRHIHWRSVARSGQLITKEFAEETRPGLTLILDRWFPASNDDKHTAFEWAVKVAASLGEYAQRQGYPLHLRADAAALPVPGGALPADALLQYLARVQPTVAPGLEPLLTGQGLQSFVAVVVPWPHAEIIEALIALHQRGFTLLVALLNPVTFPNASSSTPDAVPIAGELKAAGIDTLALRFGPDWMAQIQPDGAAQVLERPEITP
jgi:uncharacterized protein (DUF58 family)